MMQSAGEHSARRLSSLERKCSSARISFVTWRSRSSKRSDNLFPRRPNSGDCPGLSGESQTLGPKAKVNSGRTPLQKRNATVAVIGAGDYIGGEIAKKFAAEGFTVFAGRRNGTKLEPLVKEIEAAGGAILPPSLDTRREGGITAVRGHAD